MSTPSRHYKVNEHSTMSLLMPIKILIWIAAAVLAGYTLWYIIDGSDLTGKSLSLGSLEVTQLTKLGGQITIEGAMTCSSPIDTGCIPAVDVLTVGVLNVTDTLTANNTNLVGETTCLSSIGSSCIPSDLIFNTLLVNNLTVHNLTHINAMTETHINAKTLNVEDGMTCTTNNNVINQNCFDISNKQCPGGVLGSNCIPAIMDNSITGTQIASGTVTSDNILDGSIVDADVHVAANIAGSKIAGNSITNTHLTGGITSAKLACDTQIGAVCLGTYISRYIFSQTANVNIDQAFQGFPWNFWFKTIGASGTDIAVPLSGKYQIRCNVKFTGFATARHMHIGIGVNAAYILFTNSYDPPVTSTIKNIVMDPTTVLNNQLYLETIYVTNLNAGDKITCLHSAVNTAGYAVTPVYGVTATATDVSMEIFQIQ